MVVRISDKTQNYSKVTKLLVKPKFIQGLFIYHSNIPVETLSLLDCDILLFYHMRFFPLPKPKS